MRIGGNLEQMEVLQRTFSDRAGDADRLRSDLSAAVEAHITTNWEGPAAEAFREAWNSQFNPALTRLMEALNDAAREVGNRRDAIRQAGS